MGRQINCHMTCLSRPFYIPLATGNICPEANYKKEQCFIPACLKIWAGPACPDANYLNAIGPQELTVHSLPDSWQLTTCLMKSRSGPAV